MKIVLVNTDAKFTQLMNSFKKHDVCGFDTEAVGPVRRYSQAKDRPFLNVNRSTLVGASWAFPDQKCYYMPVRHKKKCAKMTHLREALAATGELPRVWAHNVKFDSRMVHSEGVDCRRWNWADSMLMAWGLYSRGYGIGLKHLAKLLLDRDSPEWLGSVDNTTGEEVLTYACHDALNALEVGEALRAQVAEELPRLANWIVDVDTRVVEILGRAERDGIPLNLDKLEATLGAEAEAEMRELAAQWNSLVPGVDYNSPKALQALFEEGLLVGRGKTKEGLCQTGKEILEWNMGAGNPSPVGRELAKLALALRVAGKVVNQYTSGFREECAQWPDGRLHPELSIHLTSTTRFNSANPNIQNQLSRGKYAPLLRSCFEAEPGWVYVAADYSQQEPRIQAELANQIWRRSHDDDCALYKLYTEGAGDIHQANADAMGRPRADGKTYTMGWQMYGGAPKGCAEKFNIPLKEAKELIEKVDAAFPELPLFRKVIGETCLQREPWPYVTLISGHRRWLKDMVPERWAFEDPEEYTKAYKFRAGKYNIPVGNREQVHRAMKGYGRRCAINTPIQGGGAAMAKLAMVDLDRDIWEQGLHHDARLVTMTHDEIVLTCRPDIADGMMQLLSYHMTHAATQLGFTVPFVAEAKKGKSWLEIK